MRCAAGPSVGFMRRARPEPTMRSAISTRRAGPTSARPPFARGAGPNSVSGTCEGKDRRRSMPSGWRRPARSRLFERALQRVLVLPCGVHHLIDLGFGDFIAEHAAHADALLEIGRAHV